MNDVKSLSHSKWECKYHVTWIPKYRKKKIYKELRKYLGEILKELAQQKECEILARIIHKPWYPDKFCEKKLFSK